MSAGLVADASLYERLPGIDSDGSVAPAVLERRGRKSMSRRSGQSGTIVKQGKWFRVRFRLDIRGQYDRKQMNEKICPTSGPGKLTNPQIERRAQEIIASFGANSEQHFNEAVVGTSLTFCDQSKIWLKQATTRKRRPIREGSVPTIQSALDEWLLPKLGEQKAAYRNPLGPRTFWL
jgi:hypothetical protein